MHDEINAEALDKFSNPQGVEYDLGVEGAFANFTILVGAFQPALSQSIFDTNPGPRLREKGFNIIFTTGHKEFLAQLPQADVAWILGYTASYTEAQKKEFTTAVHEFHETGGGLYLWSDNDPLFVETNWILEDLFKTHVLGNNHGDKVLKVGDAHTKGHFGRHLITSGVVNLFEGITISYPATTPAPLTVIATGTDGQACLLAAEQGPGLLSDNAGRVVLDTGYTKLYYSWDTSGTARYVLNANVWLLGLDHKMKTGAPLSRVVPK